MESEMILEVTSADIPGLLDAMTQAGLTVMELMETGPLSVRFQIRRQELSKVLEIVERRGEKWKQLRRLGLYWRIRGLYRHWLLITGFVLILMLTVWLPTRILFIQVQGNETLPTRLILEKAADCGIAFGADRGSVRSERMKNALLDALPQLQWAGVNTSGCVAVITVEERQMQQSRDEIGPGNIVALRDGIILELTAVRGTAVVKVGQAVCAGEILISGYTDCGGVILFSGAKGEAVGQTRHQISATTPSECLRRGEETGTETKISLFIGKNRINFCEDSGILDTGCVKMYSEYYLTLPGGWILPVRLVAEKSVRYDVIPESIDPESVSGLLSERAEGYLRSRMIAGEILSSKAVLEDFDYEGEFVCREMIGRTVYEEIITEYGEDH